MPLKSIIASLMLLLAPAGLWRKPRPQGPQNRTDRLAVHGMVFDSAYGRGIKGVFVSLDDSSNYFSSFTGEGGRYTIENVPVGRYNVFVSGSTFVQYKAEINVASCQTEFNVPLQPRADAGFSTVDITGKVADPDGKPIYRASVTYFSPLDDSVTMSTMTDQDGRFRLAAPRPGQYVVLASRPGYEVRGNTVLTHGKETGADFILPVFHH